MSKNACPQLVPPHPVHSQGCTFKPQSRCPLLNPSSPFRVLCLFILYILQETTQLSVCARQVQGSILQNFCCLVAYLCRRQICLCGFIGQICLGKKFLCLENSREKWRKWISLTGSPCWPSASANHRQTG